MAATTQIKSGGMVTFTVKVNGAAISGDVSVMSIFIENRVNRIPMAKITILDGDADTGKFDASSSATFIPGAELSVEAGYDSVNSVLFTGIITRQSIRIDAATGSALEVVCRDKCIKMAIGRKSMTYGKQKDSAVFSTIIGTYPGLSVTAAETDMEWPEQVQYYVTDWDFILSRADANGLIVTVNNGAITIGGPDADNTSVLDVKFGDNLLEFNAALDATGQLSQVKASTWDYKNQVVASAESANSIPGPGNLSAKDLSGVIGLADFQLQTQAPMETAVLTEWCKAQLVKSSYSKIQGDVKMQGTNLLFPGKYLTLQGLGPRFNGDHLVSGVAHDLSDGNWVTEASIGLSAEWFTEQPDVMAQPASGLLPGARGLFTGTVKKMYEDPDAQLRILVDVPLFGQPGDGLWARMGSFYATNGAGAFFLPEPGDEVILGFLNEDPRYPVILGSLYSASKHPQFKGLDADQKNSVKAIVSRSGLNIQFDDDKQVLTIQTPSKNTIVLDDKQKQITVTDQNKNSMVFDANGITVTSPGVISFTADKQIQLTGKLGVQVKAPNGDIALTGINIKESADVQYSSDGGQMSKITSGAELTLKSAMVMIN